MPTAIMVQVTLRAPIDCESTTAQPSVIQGDTNTSIPHHVWPSVSSRGRERKPSRKLLENIEQKDEPVTFAQDSVPDVIDGPTTKAHYSTVDAGANTSMTDEATSSVHGSADVSASITSISENSRSVSRHPQYSRSKPQVLMPKKLRDKSPMPPLENCPISPLWLCGRICNTDSFFSWRLIFMCLICRLWWLIPVRNWPTIV